MNTHFNNPPYRITTKSSKNSSAPATLRILGHSLALAEDIEALEDCLALERASGEFPHATQATGIFSPSAVPYCEFLMLHNGFGKLLAVTRLMSLGAANPILGPLETGRFQRSALVTALRYSREQVVEMGSPAFLPGCDTVKATKLLWRGLSHYMARKNFGFVMGSDVLPKFQNGVESLALLMKEHGLNPDLEAEAFSKFRSGSLEAVQDSYCPKNALNSASLPPGLREALRRGCRLAAEPVLNQSAGRWEVIWVASREMLVTGDNGDQPR